MRAAFTMVLALSSAMLAGCVGGSEGASTVSEAPPPIASAANFGQDTGAVSGRVVDPELLAIPDAQVALLKTAYSGQSAADGSFTLSNVAPGEYVLAAAKLGYDSVTQKVLVEAGKETSGLRLVLATVAVVEAYYQMYPFDGFITCSIGNEVVLSEECGQGLQTSSGNIGQDPNNKIDWKFNLQNMTNLESVFMELNWKPAAAAAQQLGFNVAHGFKCTPSCSATKEYCSAFSVYGKPVVKCDKLHKEDLKGAKAPWDITARAWAAPSPISDPPNIVLQQSFQMYRTEFFGEPRPETYSALQDK